MQTAFLDDIVFINSKPALLKMCNVDVLSCIVTSMYHLGKIAILFDWCMNRISMAYVAVYASESLHATTSQCGQNSSAKLLGKYAHRQMNYGTKLHVYFLECDIR